MDPDDINDLIHRINHVLFPIFTHGLVALCAFSLGVKLMTGWL